MAFKLQLISCVSYHFHIYGDDMIKICLNELLILGAQCSVMDATAAFRRLFVGGKFRSFTDFEKKLKDYMNEYYVIWTVTSSERNPIDRRTRYNYVRYVCARHEPRSSTSSGKRLVM